MSALILLVVFIIATTLYWNWIRNVDGAPFVPMDAGVVQRVVNMAKIGKKDVFYDLGSGDGRLVIAAAMKGAKAYGVELDKLRVIYSRIWIKLLRLTNNAIIIQNDVFKQDMSDATVVCTYLLQGTNDKLQSKLKKELKPGTKVISVAFEYKGWEPEKVDPRGTIYGPIMLYKL